MTEQLEVWSALGMDKKHWWNLDGKFSKHVLKIVLRELNWLIYTDLRNKSTIWESDKAASEEEVEEEGEVVARHNHNLSKVQVDFFNWASPEFVGR